MMRNILPIIFYTILFCGCRSSVNKDPFQKELTEKEATEDFKAFRSILESSHPSLNIYITEKKLDQLFDSTQKTISDNITVGELFSKYVNITNEIGCSHTLMDIPTDIYDSLGNRKFFFPLIVKLVGNKLLVNVNDQDLPAGTEITAINKQKAGDISQQIMKYEAVEGRHRKTQNKLAAENFALNYFYANGSKTIFNIDYIDTSGKKGSIVMKPVSLFEWNRLKNEQIYYYDRNECDYDMSIYQEQGYAYMRIGTFSYNSIEKEEAFENFCMNSFELLQFKKEIHSLIIDVRNNSGGDLYFSTMLFSYISKEPFKEFESAYSKINTLQNEELLDKDFSINQQDRVNQKLSKNFIFSPSAVKYSYADSLINEWPLNKLSFKGNVYVITNSGVASAASYFSVMVKNSGRGLIVGEETTGGNFSGNGFTNLNYSLPYSKLNLIFPYAHLVYSYKEKKNSGSGLLPNFIVPDTDESFKENIDNQHYFIRDSLISKNQKTR